jgi:hypothetical protein
MTDINTALAASKDAVDQLIVLGQKTGPAWTAPRAPGKWSPSQIVEHVARALEESANVASGRPSKFPKLPAILHPVVRGLLFRRVLKKAAFPKAKTNKAMDPASGPPTPEKGRARLESAHRTFDEACRQLASRGERMRTTTLEFETRHPPHLTCAVRFAPMAAEYRPRSTPPGHYPCSRPSVWSRAPRQIHRLHSPRCLACLPSDTSPAPGGNR